MGMRRFGVTLACLASLTLVSGCAVVGTAALGAAAGGAAGAAVSGGPGIVPGIVIGGAVGAGVGLARSL